MTRPKMDKLTVTKQIVRHFHKKGDIDNAAFSACNPSGHTKYGERCFYDAGLGNTGLSKFEETQMNEFCISELRFNPIDQRIKWYKQNKDRIIRELGSSKFGGE